MFIVALDIQQWISFAFCQITQYFALLFTTIRTTYNESMCRYSCLTYQAGKPHLNGPHYIVICGLSGCTTSLHSITYTARCSEERLLKGKFVLCFSLQLLCETFLILRRNELDIMKNVYWPCMHSADCF